MCAEIGVSPVCDDHDQEVVIFNGDIQRPTCPYNTIIINIEVLNTNTQE